MREPLPPSEKLAASEKLAEREGFEPSVGYPTHDFQSCTFDHSVTSPDRLLLDHGRLATTALLTRTRREHVQLEERGGFEPPLPLGKVDFESTAFNHSAISPGILRPGSGIPGRTTQVSEELPQEPCGLGLARPPNHLELVIETRNAREISQRADESALRVAGGEHHEADPSQNDRSRAHGARLEGDVERAPVEAPGSNRGGRGAKGEDLGVGRGIQPGFALVATAPDNLVPADDDGPHGDLAFRAGDPSLVEGFGHEAQMDI